LRGKLAGVCALPDEVVDGGKSVRLRWALTQGLGQNTLEGIRGLPKDWRAEAGYWSSLASHLADARGEAERICDALRARPLPPVFAECYGGITIGDRGGIVCKGTRLHVPLTPG
jgi:hypothetical protein